MRMALDTRSRWMQLLNMIFANSGQVRIEVADWIHDEFSVYFDLDKQWLERLDSRNAWQLRLENELREVPVGVFIPSKNNLKMTAFVVAARAAIDRFAPHMVQWDTVPHNDAQYVVGNVANSGIGAPHEMPSLYYVTPSRRLPPRHNARVIERVIDRHLVVKDAGDAASQESEIAAPANADPSIKPQLVLEGTGQGAEIMAKTNYQSGLRQMHRLAWSNIPIMNYFRARYPDRDPRQVYFDLFGEWLMEPSGAEYQWSEQYGTYLSTEQGFHLYPKAGSPMPSSIEPGDFIRTSLGFQDGGLRATLHVEQ